MNVVFWLWIVMALAGIWALCTPLFRKIGKEADSIKEEIKNEVKEGENDK